MAHAAARDAVRGFDPNMPAADIRTMDAVVAAPPPGFILRPLSTIGSKGTVSDLGPQSMPVSWSAVSTNSVSCQLLLALTHSITASTGCSAIACAKAGLMVRQSLAPDSAYAMALVTSAQGVAFQQRADAGRMAATEMVIPNLRAPYWLRLTRKGGTFMFAASADGKEWTPANTIAITMTDPVYAGLAVTSHHSGVLCRATFEPWSNSAR